jgi:decaprenylphospho-beta-D-ribofuranose 2-oxidase
LAFETELSGWGNCPVERCRVVKPQSVAGMRSIVSAGPESTYIARGLGRSYGDPSLNRGQGVIVLTGVNRFLAFDESTGQLECETGVTLAEILEHLLPRGWYVATTPGTKFITIGGAIAADVHGKNHHVDGSFGNAVLDFRLLTASGEEITCSREQNPEIFWATVGGMGLTGLITRARVQLRRVPSSFVAVDYRRTRDLDGSLECFEATNRDYRYSVAWIDCLSRGASMGRSVVMLGNDAPADDVRRQLRVEPYSVPRDRKSAIPFHFPGFVLNSWSVKAFNALYYSRHPDSHKLVDYNSYFYPLDHIKHWNRLYGRRGFYQFQALLPPETSRSGLIALLERLARTGRASFLAVLKSSGPGNDGMLSYLYQGHTLALDIPNKGAETLGFLGELDRILLEHGGRLYLAKDAAMSAEAFAAMYPRLGEFRAVKARIDPTNRFVSSLARRLRIVEGI